MNSLTIIVVIIIVVLISNTIYTNSKDIGDYGESLIEKKIKKSKIFGKKGEILRNVYIPKGNGETSEIDLLFITTKGIFVIESKNYSGYIFGSENNQKWTVTLNGGRIFYGVYDVEKYQFYNPIKQNATHIRNLNNYLGESYTTYSLIVFSDRCDLMRISINSPNIFVCNRSRMNSIINQIWENSPDVISNEKVIEIVEKLKQIQNDESIKEQHKQQIKEKLNNTIVCPVCGGKLVKRISKFGVHKGEEFYGCSNYPTCKYIKK